MTVNATNGTVTKLPDQATYDHGTVVQLTAVPATGYHFVNWTGDASGTDLTTSVTMDGDKTVTANFAINTYTLTYRRYGRFDHRTAAQTVDYGGSGTLVTAEPPGYHFVDWSDGVLTAARTDTNVTANITATANFESTRSRRLTRPEPVTSTVYLHRLDRHRSQRRQYPLVLTLDGVKSLSSRPTRINTYTLTYTAGRTARSRASRPRP